MAQGCRLPPLARMRDENSGETRDGIGDAVSHRDALSRRTIGDARESVFVVTLPLFRGDDDEVVVVVEAAGKKCTCRGLTNG
jgi:hypothetical protein